MVGIIAASHGNYAIELIRSAEMIWGKLTGVDAIALLEDESTSSLEEKIAASTKQMGTEEILILVDMLGGTPFNATAASLNNTNINVVTGLNLPMLLTLLAQREANLAEMTTAAVEGGKRGIVNVREELAKVQVHNGQGI